MEKIKKEQGSAIVLSLAVLALFTIVMMSFVTNALLESRVAEAKTSMSSSQNIAETALSRALAGLKYYITLNDPNNGFFDENVSAKFNNFVSWDGTDQPNDTDVTLILNDKFDEKNEYYVGIEDAMNTNFKNAELEHITKNNYLYLYPTEKANTKYDKPTRWFNSYLEQPRWQYVYRVKMDKKEKILGRFAYAVLPDNGQVNVNIFQGTDTAPQRTGVNTNEFRIEAFDYTFGLDVPKGKLMGDVIRKQANEIERNDIANFINKNIHIPGEVDDWTLLYKVLSFNEPNRESPSNKEKFYRYNTSTNKRESVDLLDLSTFDWDTTSIDDIFLKIPFLKNIGSEKGNFETIKDFRKQIAANLIDFNDSDNIPTSDDIDTPASSWNLTDKIPKYTGNEQTPYIYEMSFNLGLKVFDAEPTKLEFEFSPEFKLIDLYKSDISADLSFSVNELKANIAITKYEAIFEFKYNNGVTDVTTSLPFEITDAPIEFSQELIKAEPPSTYTISNIKVPLGDTTIVAKLTPTVLFKTEDLTDLFNDSETNEKIKTKIKNSYPTIIGSPKFIKFVKIDELSRGVDFRIGSVLLKNGSNGIDYVNIFTGNIADLEDKHYLSKNFTTLIDPDDDIDKGCEFNIGYLQGIDPRQNLHIKDWLDLNGDSFSGPLSLHKKAINLTNGINSYTKNVDKDGFDLMISDIAKYKLEKAENIFNNPMTQYHLLNAISRGSAWETLNLRMAGGEYNTGSWDRTKLEKFLITVNEQDINSTEGTSLADGDGGILNQIALNNTSPYKININTSSKNIWRGLLSDLNIESLDSSDPPQSIEQSKINNVADTIATTIRDKEVFFKVRSDLLKPLKDISTLTDADADAEKNILQFAFSKNGIDLTDGELEDIVDKLMHIIKAEQYPEYFQILIVAQSIKDVGGFDDKNQIGVDITIRKKCQKCDNSGGAVKPTEKNSQMGKFDFKKCIGTESESDQSKIHWIYFDEIMSEDKILATVRRDDLDFKVIKIEKLP